MKLKTFKIGGVHPPENKMAAGSPIVALTLPKRVSIPMNQHIGAPANPVVKKGDDVKVGTLIGKGESFISANIHSSVSGKVFAVDTVMDTTGYKVKAVIIDVEGDVWEDSIIKNGGLIKEIKLEPAEIVEKIKAC
ncbi:MAG TPA: electron transporter RnfC, partial [bacterium]|nr:electron transporter RnfC [bacterium]